MKRENEESNLHNIINKNKINRRSLKKNKPCDSNKMSSKIFRVLGINASGLSSKVESFDKVLFDRKPSIWFIQETKRKPTDPRIKAKNFINYQVFEMQRVKTRE